MGVHLFCSAWENEARGAIVELYRTNMIQGTAVPWTFAKATPWKGASVPDTWVMAQPAVTSLIQRRNDAQWTDVTFPAIHGPPKDGAQMRLWTKTWSPSSNDQKGTVLQIVATVSHKSCKNEEGSIECPLAEKKPPTDKAHSQEEKLSKSMVDNIGDCLELSSLFHKLAYGVLISMGVKVRT